MKTGWACTALLSMACMVVGLSARAATTAPAHLYVSTAGRDFWSGRLPEPNAAKTDGPFATLDRARNEIRSLKKTNAIPATGLTVLVRGGTYYLSKPFDLTAQDSGTAAAPITYQAFPGENVRISAAKPVRGFTVVKDPKTLARLDKGARGHVLRADLKAQGVTDVGPVDGGGAEIFYDDQPMTLARWPNKGFVRIADIVVKDGHKIHGIVGSKVGKFKYTGNRPSRWLHEADPWLHGYWFWDWSDQREKIASIDTKDKIISLAPPYHTYGYRKGQWYYAFNMLIELDSPGEWYIDRAKDILYFWPPRRIDLAKTVVSMLPNVINMKDTSFVTLQGLTIEGARDTGVVISGGKNDHVADCVIRNVGSGGIAVHGLGHSVTGCEIYQTGSSGISMNGGDRKTLAPGGLLAENNRIHNYGRVKPMYSPGISLNGVGNRADHNLIYDAPHIGIFFSGNDEVIEYNEIHHVCLQANDAGAIYTGRNWTMRGNQIRYNYLHDIDGFEHRGCVGVYLDDMFSSAAIYGNVFYKVTRAAFIGGGRDCSIENNIFVDCKPAIHVDCRALNWAAAGADAWIKEAKEKGTISGIAYNKPPYSVRYPKLVTILQDNPKAPVGDVIARNICWGGKWDEIEKAARPFLTMKDNLIDKDPHFVDAKHLNFHLKKDSPAYKLGFKDIPIDKIGLLPKAVSAKLSMQQTERALDAPEISSSDRMHAWINLERADATAGDSALAVREGKKAVAVRGLSPKDTVLAHLELGHVEAAAHDFGKARRQFSNVADNQKAPVAFRSLAQLQVARCYFQEDKLQKAKDAYHALTKLPDAPPQHVAEAEEGLREIARKEAGKPMLNPAEDRLKIPSLPEPGKTFYVAPNGADTNSGAREAPFATLQHAIDAIAAVKAKGNLPKGGLEICLEGGVYRLQKGITLTSAASGTKSAPIVITGCSGESARLSGGKPVTGFKPVTDPAILARLPKESRGKVLVANLKAQGITHYAPLVYRGVGCGAPATTELFFNGTPMTLARWPNSGFLKTGKVLETGWRADDHGAVFTLDNDRIKRWSHAPDIWLHGYWYFNWADNSIAVASIDPATHQIHTVQSGNYGIKKGQDFYVFNLLEEIDQPGEWYLDRKAGLLYFYPPSDPAKAQVEMSLLQDPMIQLDGAAYVTLKNLTLEFGAGDGVVATNCEHCLVAGCVVRRLGSSGVTIVGGHDDGALSCDIYTLGRGGTTIIGGDRKTLTPGGQFIENCHIYDFSRIDRTYTPAVQIDGVGNRIVHNVFNHSPGHAIRVEGNDHLIEFNDVYDVARETDDQGGLDIWGNPSYRGNVFRYNYWHDIGNGRPVGQAGIRLDDAISGTVIYGNVFCRCSESNFGGVQINGGKDNWIDNNVFVDCRYAISFSQWDKKRWEKYLESPRIADLLTKDVNASAPPYTTHYPALLHLHDGIDINNVWRNVVYHCGKFLARDHGIENRIDNYVTDTNPGFVDAATGDFTLKADSPVYAAIGFHRIPFDQIGLYNDAYRAAIKAATK